jgi:hypothetical protein
MGQFHMIMNKWKRIENLDARAEDDVRANNYQARPNITKCSIFTAQRERA